MAQAAKSPFYGALFAEHGITPASVKSLDDVRHLPFTTKQDLRASYPDKLLALPQADMVRMHVSSGTTGTPTAIYHTKKRSGLVGLAYGPVHAHGRAAPHRTSSRTCRATAFFTGGLGIHCGAEKLGCLTIPAGAGNSQRQIKLLMDSRSRPSTSFLPTPCTFPISCRTWASIPAPCPVRIALVGAEPYTEETRRRLEDIFAMKVYNSYGLSEMNGPGVAFECPNSTACTSGRTPICPRSWTRPRVSPCPTANSANWS